MNQSIELMRRRHAYYTRLITDNDIHTAQEFYDRFSEQFMLIGTQLSMNNGNCDIYIECDGYDYEYYTIVDGESDGFASVSPVVAFKTWCTNLDANIFEINHLDEAFFSEEHNMKKIRKVIAAERRMDIQTRRVFIDGLINNRASLPKTLVDTILTAQKTWQYHYQTRHSDIIDRIDYLTDLLLKHDYHPNSKTFLKDGDEVVCIIYTSLDHPISPDEFSRIRELSAIYFGDMKIKWYLIKASNPDLNTEIELKHLCIKK